MIKDFLMCNKKVYYRINHPELQISDRDMEVGNIVHKAIELYWDNQEKAKEHINQSLNMTLPNDKSALKRAEDCMQTFFHVFRQHLSKEDEIEKKFKIPWGKDVFVVGKMDRVSSGCVFDWKTAGRPSTDTSKDVQFILYDWAYRSLYKSSPVAVYYAALATGGLVMYKRDRVAETALFGEVIPQLISAIKTKDYVPNGVFRRACYKCPYAESCLKELIPDVLDNSVLT